MAQFAVAKGQTKRRDNSAIYWPTLPLPQNECFSFNPPSSQHPKKRYQEKTAGAMKFETRRNFKNGSEPKGQEGLRLLLPQHRHQDWLLRQAQRGQRPALHRNLLALETCGRFCRGRRKLGREQSWKVQVGTFEHPQNGATLENGATLDL